MNTHNMPNPESQTDSNGAEATLPAPNIKLSNRALQELQHLTTQYAAGQLTRLGVKGGGCAGLSYILEAGLPRENDYLIHIGSITLAVDPSHALYLDGLLLDIGEGLNNRGFIFENPNAGSTCGCGTSFSL